MEELGEQERVEEEIGRNEAGWRLLTRWGGLEVVPSLL